MAACEEELGRALAIGGTSSLPGILILKWWAQRGLFLRDAGAWTPYLLASPDEAAWVVPPPPSAMKEVRSPKRELW